MKLYWILILLFALPIVSGQSETVELSLSIPPKYQSLYAGSDLLTSIKIVNLAKQGRVDVILEYKIKDDSGDVLFKKKETMAVETQANFVRSIPIAQHHTAGQYQLQGVITFSDGHTAIANQSFEIIKEPFGFSKLWHFGLAGLIGFVILLITCIKLRPQIKKMILRVKIHRIVKRRKNSLGLFGK